MSCHDTILSNETIDVIIPLDDPARMQQEPSCIQPVSSLYSIYYYKKESVPPLSIERYTYSAIPKCLGLLDTTALETSGIIQLQNQPALSLKGQDVLVGFVDTGIAYENECFRNTDGTTRIMAIWDQNEAPEAGTETVPERIPPDGFVYGVEYTKERIDQALQSETPFQIVPQRDENGHGTLLASIACGSEEKSGNFVGAAPLSDILMVKLKPAKQYLKDFYYIPDNIPVYQENDIMAAVAYLDKKARSLGKPLVICIGLGTNNGSHSGTGALSDYLNEIGGLWRRCVVIASGNETNERHHFFGRSNHNYVERENIDGIGRENETESGPIKVEINVDEPIKGFYLELWANALELFSVSVRAPGGVRLPKIGARSGAHQEVEFLFEDTRVEIDYRTVGRTRGYQLIFVRFDRASRGIWTLYVYPETSITGVFHVWLPMTGMLENDVFFLNPDPDVTLTTPSAAQVPITVGGYDMITKGMYIRSGRGYSTINVVKPDFCAPAVNVQGITARGDYTTGSGTSIAAAITAGGCAQIMEWGVTRKNNISLNSVEIGNILIRGCQRENDRSYPNTQWGYGTLDVYGAFQNL